MQKTATKAVIRQASQPNHTPTNSPNTPAAPNSACATRHVGGDQNASLSFNACRRAIRNAPATTRVAVASQSAPKARMESK